VAARPRGFPSPVTATARVERVFDSGSEALTTPAVNPLLMARTLPPTTDNALPPAVTSGCPAAVGPGPVRGPAGRAGRRAPPGGYRAGVADTAAAVPAALPRPEPVPAVVVLHVWGVSPRAVPLAVARMALDRRHLRTSPARFWKLLGTGDGRTFTPRDADPGHWATLTTWDDPADAAAFERSPAVAAWDRLAHERLRVEMVPVAARGRWSGRAPFGEPEPRRGTTADGPVASITRARIRLGRGRAFWRAVPPVSTDLQQVPGLRLAVGIGEAPVGLQGTFSLWDDAASLRDFAHRRAAHRDVVERTAREGWYAEELFARFTVRDLAGTYRGATP